MVLPKRNGGNEKIDRKSPIWDEAARNTHGSYVASEVIWKQDIGSIRIFGRVASGVASLLGELVCTSSFVSLTARREIQK